jgi:hypothetical protein
MGEYSINSFTKASEALNSKGMSAPKSPFEGD